VLHAIITAWKDTSLHPICKHRSRLLLKGHTSEMNRHETRHQSRFIVRMPTQYLYKSYIPHTDPGLSVHIPTRHCSHSTRSDSQLDGLSTTLRLSSCPVSCRESISLQRVSNSPDSKTNLLILIISRTEDLNVYLFV